MLIEISNSVLLIVDIQEKLFSKIKNNETIKKNSIILSKTFKLLNLPIYLTEQYPNGLGKTINSLANELKKISYFEKSSFSCAAESLLTQSLQNQKRNQILISGIETHICVLQSVFDLKQKGFEPFVIQDAVGSRNQNDHNLALKRFSNFDVNICTTEMVVFELLRNSKHPKFREISQLIK